MEYDPNSSDAVFSRILEQLDKQDKVAQETRVEFLQHLRDIKEQTTKTNGRVLALENWQTDIKARIAVITVLVSGAVSLAGWLLSNFIKG